MIDPDLQLLPTPSEYRGVPRWEQKRQLRDFRLYLAQGLAAHPDKPAIARERALYLGWGASSRIWGTASFCTGIVTGLIGTLLDENGAGFVILLASGVTLVLATVAVAYVRVFQATRRHPTYRRYRRRVDRTDWNDYGDLT